MAHEIACFLGPSTPYSNLVSPSESSAPLYPAHYLSPLSTLRPHTLGRKTDSPGRRGVTRSRMRSERLGMEIEEALESDNRVSGAGAGAGAGVILRVLYLTGLSDHSDPSVHRIAL